MIWLFPHILLPLFPVRMLSLFLILPVCRRSSLLTGERREGWERSQIIRLRESLTLYKSFGILCVLASTNLCDSTESSSKGVSILCAQRSLKVSLHKPDIPENRKNKYDFPSIQFECLKWFEIQKPAMAFFIDHWCIIKYITPNVQLLCGSME